MGIVSTKIGLQVRLPSKNRNTKARQHDTYAEISSLCALATAPTQGVEAFKSLWSGSLQVFVYISLGPIATEWSAEGTRDSDIAENSSTCKTLAKLYAQKALASSVQGQEQALSDDF